MATLSLPPDSTGQSFVSWTELKIDSTSAYTEALEELLFGCGAAAVTCEEGAHSQPVYEPAPGQHPLWQQVRVVALFPVEVDTAAVLATVEQELAQACLSSRIEPVVEQQWERAWMDHFQPMLFGKRLRICPSWMKAPEDDRLNLLLDPGLAFGTGTHPTTALCLEWLDRHCTEGQTVLDYGCGSGILAIAAAVLGARSVLAVDIDAQALQATEQNAAANGVDAVISTCYPNNLVAPPVDCLVANILAGPLITLADRFAALLQPGGRIVLSGILQSQADEVLKSYECLFEMDAPGRRDEWVRLSGRRRP